jgi:hypothetical protein
MRKNGSPSVLKNEGYTITGRSWDENSWEWQPYGVLGQTLAKNHLTKAGGFCKFMVKLNCQNFVLLNRVK